MQRKIIAASLLAFGPAPFASAQLTVDFTSAGWQDFGTANTLSVSGNFQPGWQTLQASPDIGFNLFGSTNQTLSGAPDDAALWFNQFEAGNINNEIARLSLKRFSIGQVYSLDFSATILQDLSNGWTGSVDRLEVAISGTTSSSFSSTVLTDAANDDGMNTWFAQSIVFTAMDTSVSFAFGQDAVVGNTNISRLGVDGFSLRIIPAPAAAPLLALAALTGVRRKR